MKVRVAYVQILCHLQKELEQTLESKMENSGSKPPVDIQGQLCGGSDNVPALGQASWGVPDLHLPSCTSAMAGRRPCPSGLWLTKGQVAGGTA
jgi:hypothetical protein